MKQFSPGALSEGSEGEELRLIPRPLLRLEKA